MTNTFARLIRAVPMALIIAYLMYERLEIDNYAEVSQSGL